MVAERVFGGVARRVVADDGDLARVLFAAAVPKRAVRYVSEALLVALVAALVAGGFGSLMVATALPALPSAPVVAVGVVAGLAVASATLGFYVLYPRMLAAERAREIDANLPHGLSYLLAMAAAGMQPRALFRSLGRQRVYGALADECAVIARDLDLLGMDILAALRAAQERTPSDKFKEFLQGAISSFSSGVDLETYLKVKGEQYTREEIESQRQSLDVIGLMAETFLVIVVAAPLFLLVLLSVMAMTQGKEAVLFGYLVALLYMPVAQFGVSFIVKSLNPRVWS